MKKQLLVRPRKNRHGLTQEWLDNCALEGIFPDQQILNEFEMIDASDMTPEEYLTYLDQKYRTITKNKS